MGPPRGRSELELEIELISNLTVGIDINPLTKNCGTKLLNWRCGLGLEWLPSGPLEQIISAMDLHLDAHTFRAGK
jgi:hypothetical protein